MVMKRKLGLELYGPCSNTGAEPDAHDTIVTINENGRVSFHKLEVLNREGQGMFVIHTTDGEVLLSSDCYLLYTTDATSDVKRDIRRLRKNIRRKL